MKYLVAVLDDRIAAESAYTTLEKAGLPMNRVVILGRGYRSADEYGLIDPKVQAIRQMKLMALWLIPFGCVAGVAFNLSTKFVILGTPLYDQILGGLLGAIAGAMGSFFIGGGGGIAFGSGDALVYRNRLEQGKYIIVVEEPDFLSQNVVALLRDYDPEYLQGYNDN